MIKRYLLCMCMMTLTTAWPTLCRADEPVEAEEKAIAVDNAALSYWQAFAILPEWSDAEEELLGDWETAALDEPTEQLLERGGAALMMLRRGATRKDCRWDLALEQGPEALMPHVSKGRQLMRLACLRARHHLASGEHEEGLADALAAETLARHLGREPLLISFLVQAACQEMALQAIAPYLNEIDSEPLTAFAAKWTTLPPGSTVKESLLGEKQTFVVWFRDELLRADKDVRRRRAAALLGATENDAQAALAQVLLNPLVLGPMVKGLEARYDELIALLDLPADEFDVAYEKFIEERVKKSYNPLVSITMPAIDSVVAVQRRSLVRHQQLLAAIEILTSPKAVEKAIEKFPDPTTGKPFEYAKTPGGFTLTSKLIYRDEPVSMRVGRDESD